MYVGTKMTLNNVTPDCITVLLSPKKWKTKKIVKINSKEIEWVKYFVDIHLTSGGKLLKKILNKFDKEFYQSNIRKVHTILS